MKKVNNVSVQSFLTKRAVRSTALLTRSWRSFLLLFACLIGSVNALAQVEGEVIEKNGFYYYVHKQGQKFELTVFGTTLTGAQTVPPTVRIKNGQELEVTYIAEKQGRTENFKELTELTLPNTCRSIGYFGGSTKLKKLHIPASVTFITLWAVAPSYLPALESFEVDENNPKYKSEDGVLMSRDGAELYLYPPKKAMDNEGVYEISEGVKKVSSYFFNKKLDLTRIVYPSTLTDFGAESAFWGCDNLTSIEIRKTGQEKFSIKDNVIYNKEETKLICYPIFKKETSYTVLSTCIELAPYAFSQSAALTSLNLNKVRTLKERSVFNLSQLTSLTFSGEVNLIEDQALIGLGKLENFVMEGEGTAYKVDKGILYNTAGTKLIACPQGKKIIPELLSTITHIGAGAFRNNSSMTSITIPALVEEIGEDAFFYCTALKTVTFEATDKLREIKDKGFRHCWSLSDINLPSSVTSIGARGFEACRKLPNLTLPVSLQTIGGYGFSGCTFTKLIIPAALKEIGTYAFLDCKYLETVEVEDKSLLQTIGTLAFFNAPLSSFSFLGSAEKFSTIKAGAFAYMKDLTTFTFPKNLKNIEAGAFLGCNNLERIIFPEDAEITAIKNGAFADCVNLKNVELPKKLQVLEDAAFRGCKELVKMKVSKAIQVIGPRAFEDCPKFDAVEFIEPGESENDKFSIYDGVLYTKNKDKLLLLPPAKTTKEKVLKIPTTVAVIGEYACYKNTEVEKIVIPPSVTKIEGFAFSGCTALKNLVLLHSSVFEDIDIKSVDESDALGNVAGKGAMKSITVNVPLELRATYLEKPYYQKFKEVSAFVSKTFSLQGGKDGEITAKYQSEDVTSEKPTATLVKVIGPASAKTFVVPETVEMGEGSTLKTYKVTSIGTEAFVGSNFEEVIIAAKDLNTLGARAFATNKDKGLNDSKIQRIIFTTSTVPVNHDNRTFHLPVVDQPFEPQQKIHVKKNDVDNFKIAPNWENYVSQISYTIEGVAIKNKYVTFAREFDVDFDFEGTSDLPGVTAPNENIEVYARVGTEMKGSGDYGDKTEYKVSFKPWGEAAGKKAYVPKGSGVLLKNNSDTEQKFYYRIGEKASPATPIPNNVLHGVTLNKQYVGKETGKRYYVLQGGLFRFVPNGYTQFIMDPHRAYLVLENAAPAAGAPDVLSIYTDGDITTGIDGVNAEISAPVYYNLQGVRTTKPSRGLYLRNGQKTFIH